MPSLIRGVMHPDGYTPEEAAASMVEWQVSARGIRNPRILAAMRETPRHLFVPEEERDSAYADRALPIAERQTISQPYIVALMTDLLAPERGDRILEIGTGSGYQAAILSRLAAEVFSVEIVPALARDAEGRLARLNISNVHVRQGDGAGGWPEAGPFDGIIVTCAVDAIPEPLTRQLRQGGRVVLPLGSSLAYQHLTVATRERDGRMHMKTVTGVVFVPMTGPHGMGTAAPADA